MISFFKNPHHLHFAVQHKQAFSSDDIAKLSWLFGSATLLQEAQLDGIFLGPRKEMITPWSTNAVEITQNMGLKGIERIEELFIHDGGTFDPMLKAIYHHPGQSIFDIEVAPHPILDVEDIATYNQSEGLALTDDEVDYLLGVAKQLGRPLTDSEVFGFSQVNSEHCRHKIFNGSFVIDGKEQPSTLFQLIKKTSKEQPGRLVSAYKDNVAFVKGPVVQQFAPKTQEKPDYFTQKDFASVLSLKAETHNFPTTVEPFNGAATGSGGEIRDRMAGGQGSVPLAGTAVYMTSYSRLEEGRSWEQNAPERPWLYQTPADILIKASNGASDFGNKFGQPLICGSVLTFEHQEGEDTFGFDKVIMQAGGVGYGKESDSIKQVVTKGDKIVILGGDNYRIGMGGGAVSSVDTGEFANAIELNAVQRSNPEMQKRVANAVRAMTEMDVNPIVSIHDHGAGGHLNCLSELVEDTGGQIAVSKLPVGDPTLSEKEIIGNESQERMGLVIKEKDINLLKAIAERERSPMFEVGEATGDHKFTFTGREGKNPIDWELSHMFGSSPKTVLTDDSSTKVFSKLSYDVEKVEEYLEAVLQLEAVACKDWLTNKVDRCVTGRVATQQTTGEIQLPLNNVAVMALDFVSNKGVATSIGHAPIPAMVDVAAGSRLAITEALTNLIWAPIADGLSGVSLSANWMWPAKNDGENYRLYKAVEAVSAYAIALGINIPTGKDSLSMTQKYPDGKKVLAPGTVVISSIGEVTDINKVVTPELKKVDNTVLLYIPIGNQKPTLGGSSLAQIIGQLGTETPDISSPDYFKNLFSTIQSAIDEGLILAGHDVSSGGLITTLLEMNFPNSSGGMTIDLTEIQGDAVEQLFNENPALVIQCHTETKAMLDDHGIHYLEIGAPQRARKVSVKSTNLDLNLDVDSYRDIWYKTSFLLDSKQTLPELAQTRFKNYKTQALAYSFPEGFYGKLTDMGLTATRTSTTELKAAIIREKGVNSDREMAYMLHLAGFDVKDVHMTDLISGRETLEDIQMIVFVGGFSNSDVLGSAKGWAGAFRYNERAKKALDAYYARPDTLSLGVCNGCQLMMELGLIFPELADQHPRMMHNESGKFECTFTAVTIADNSSVMLGTLAGSKLGIWAAHGEGKFGFDSKVRDYNVIGNYHINQYPANPNGSEDGAAMVCSDDGRHLAMMPHLERSMFPWNWPYYPADRKNDDVSPWIEAFVNARKWVEKHQR